MGCEKSLQQFMPPSDRTGRIHTDNSLEFIRACEDSIRNHDSVRPYRSETDGIDRGDHICFSAIGTIGSPRRMVDTRNGVRKLLANHTRFLGRR